MNIQQSIAQSIEKGHREIDMRVLSLVPHVRYVDEKLTNEQVKKLNSSVSSEFDSVFQFSNIPWDKHERKGWSKPDKQTTFTETRFLWKK